MYAWKFHRRDKFVIVIYRGDTGIYGVPEKISYRDSADVQALHIFPYPPCN